MRKVRWHEAGKIQALASLVRRYADAIESDLERYYHRDLLDYYRPGGISARKLSVLISHLPPESATATAMRNAAAESGGQAEGGPEGGPEIDPSKGRWTHAELLLAGITDELKWFRYEYRQVKTNNNAGSPPNQVERPGVKSKKKAGRLKRSQQFMLDPRMRGEWHE